jgi:hypothetical protein
MNTECKFDVRQLKEYWGVCYYYSILLAWHYYVEYTWDIHNYEQFNKSIQLCQYVSHCCYYVPHNKKNCGALVAGLWRKLWVGVVWYMTAKRSPRNPNRTSFPFLAKIKQGTKLVELPGHHPSWSTQQRTRKDHAGHLPACMRGMTDHALESLCPQRNGEHRVWMPCKMPTCTKSACSTTSAQ